MTFNELHSGDWFKRNLPISKVELEMINVLFRGTVDVIFKKLDMFHAVSFSKDMGWEITHFYPIEEVIFIDSGPEDWPEGL